jgi:predicted signal transduction protein with EAL and GGDEF domain
LKEVAQRLLQHARDEDAVCRNGGDEFLYLLMNPQGSENIERIAGAVLKNIAQPIAIGELQLVIKSSIGIAVYPENGTTGEQLIRNADAAMYRAKRHGLGSIVFHDEQLTSEGSLEPPALESLQRPLTLPAARSPLAVARTGARARPVPARRYLTKYNQEKSYGWGYRRKADG